MLFCFLTHIKEDLNKTIAISDAACAREWYKSGMRIRFQLSLKFFLWKDTHTFLQKKNAGRFEKERGSPFNNNLTQREYADLAHGQAN